MTADDLRARIRAGELAALSDPALPLHLLADGPGVDWWRTGCYLALKRLQARLQGKPELRGFILTSEDQPPLNLGPGVIVLRPQVATRAELLADCRRLRALLPSAPPEVDEALAVLERYAG